MRLIALILVAFSAHAEPVRVISNGMGPSQGFPEESLKWFETRLPTLPADFIEAGGFVPYEPLVHYADNLNWSLFGLKQFREVQKYRGFRLPPGTKILRDPVTGAWKWPVGAETAKLLRARVRTPDGRDVWQDLELRLARKIQDAPEARVNWAMGLYVRGADGSWQAVRAPDLRLVVERALTPEGGTRTVNYALTPPEACMTCHARGSYSPVDLKRGDEYVYGVNDELLTGRTRVRLSQYLSDADMQATMRELARNASEDWIELESLDQARLKANMEALQGFIDGELPQAPAR